MKASHVLMAGALLFGCQAVSAATYSLFNLKGITETTDTYPVELGVKLKTDVAGTVSAVRFYREVPNGFYAVHVWSEEGDLLGSGGASEGQGPTPGWQNIQIYPPVVIEAGQTFIASYYTNNGQYNAIENYYTNIIVRNGPIHTTDDNGVFKYGVNGGFPDQTWNGSNYLVDVVFNTEQ